MSSKTRTFGLNAVIVWNVVCVVGLAYCVFACHDSRRVFYHGRTKEVVKSSAESCSDIEELRRRVVAESEMGNHIANTMCNTAEIGLAVSVSTLFLLVVLAVRQRGVGRDTVGGTGRKEKSGRL